MKTVLSFLLMVTSLLIGFQQAIIVVYFEHYQDFIEQNYCVNKDRPQLQCHGICFLKKQLQETDDSDADSIRIYKTVDLFTVLTTKFLANNTIIAIRPGLSVYRESHYKEPNREIFVPPPIFY